MQKSTGVCIAAGFAIAVTSCTPAPPTGPAELPGSPIIGIRPTGPAELPGSPIIGIRPSVPAPPSEYCKIDNQDRSRLIVDFVNSGSVDDAGGTNVVVKFENDGVPDGPMPAMSANGGTGRMDFPLPGFCQGDGGRCKFTIKWSNQPPVEGECIIIE